MHRSLLDILICPACRSDSPLRARVERGEGDQIDEGTLTCASCAGSYPVRRGTPRFVTAEEDYCGNFGFQWQRWKSVQIDRLGGHHLSESRFFDEVPWDRDWMKGKLILEAGCGAGRFTDVAAHYGARIVACDLSDAIDACHDITRIHGDLVQTVQASIYALPFRVGAFDAAFCFGVIQHTPDPALTMESIPRFVRDDGWLAYDFYEKTPWERPWVPRYWLRRFTPAWSRERLLMLSHLLTAIFFFPAWLLAQFRPTRIYIPGLPIAVYTDPQLSIADEYRWTVLNTYDWYGPKFELRQDFRQVARQLSRLGLQDIIARPGVVTARIRSS